MKERISKISISEIRRIFELARLFPDAINLGIGEPDFATPEHIKNAARRALDEDFTHYTPTAGIPELKEAISEKLKRDNNIEADPEREIIVTTSTTQALFAAISAVIKEGDEVLIPTPAFVTYIPQATIAGGITIEVQKKEENEFRVIAEDLEKQITNKTRLIIINSPCNPTGSVLNRKDLEEIADVAIEHDLLIISDEIYEKLIYEGEHCSIASLNGMKERVITVNGFSKAYAMTGWRVGYLVADESIINEVMKLILYSTACPPSISQKAAIAALKGTQDPVEKMKREFDRRRRLVYRRLNEINGISVVEPKGAFYIFPNIKRFGMSSSRFSEYLLKESLVATVPGSGFGKYGEGYIRISYATSYDKLEEALSRIEKAISKLQ